MPSLEAGRDVCHFNVFFMEIEETASGAQRPLQGPCQGHTSLVLLSALMRKTERTPVDKEISPASSCLMSPVSHSEGNSPIRVGTLLTA